ncbi:MAG: hypothetical protein KAJ46_00660 [Sedimentisphaerales bacterium]|nr:hypothetical protein [Sedimentisphaerales bacterium]
MFDLLAQTQTATATNWSLELLKLVLPAIFGFLAVWLGLWVWHRQKRSEPKYQSLGYLNQKRLDGLLKAWSLLAYMTDVENPKAVMLWEKTGRETVYYLRPEQAREYMIALAEMFYADGYGLLLGREIKNLFYEYRSQLYGVLLKAKSLSDGGNPIRLEKDELVGRLKEIYNELNEKLREELQKIEE